ncbi:WD40 repeat domain-containing protein [Nocardia sp. NEAU-G5]|uniref:WD40 repeat domain-containing protein n=1 Tax=Nocardia albiluteola TaxID=2842303 RepID=A0ABS6ASD1_9NOCA|nr:WD40 repeat domain-containing protein [Nocardia albiluteola]MBU3060932.1 WD40 repeat domain-containing protein [Nocardia albiluteola]
MIRAAQAALTVAVIVLALTALAADAHLAPKQSVVQLKPVSADPNTSVSDVAFSPDGRSLAALVTATDALPAGPTPAPVTARTVELWNMRTGHLDWMFQDAHGHISHILFGPDGHTLVLLVADTVELWDLRNHELIATLDACPSGKNSCPDERHDCHEYAGECRDDLGYQQAAFSPDGRTLAVSGHWSDSYDSVDIWDYRTRKLVNSFPTGLPNGLAATMEPRSLHFSLDSAQLTGIGSVSGPDGAQDAVATWDVQTGSLVTQTTFDLNRSVGAFDLSHDERRLAITYNQQRQPVVEIWQLANGKIDTTLKYDVDDVGTLSFGLDDRTLAVAVDDNSIMLADTTGHHPAAKLSGPPTLPFSLVNTAAISPDGRVIVGVTLDGIALLWELGSRQFIAAKNPQCAGLCAYDGDMAFSTDSRLLALARLNGVIDIVRLQ